MKRWFGYFIISLLTINLISAVCTVNGEEIPCDIFWQQYGTLFIVLFTVAPIILIIWTIFSVFMLIDMFKRAAYDITWTQSNKLLKWLIISALTGSLAILMYYFIVYRREGKVSKEMENQSTGPATGKIMASHTRKSGGFWTDGGLMSIENNQLVFRPHKINLPSDELKIDLNNIVSIKPEEGLTSRVINLYITKKDSSTDKFLIWKRDYDWLIDKIKTKNSKNSF